MRHLGIRKMKDGWSNRSKRVFFQTEDFQVQGNGRSFYMGLVSILNVMQSTMQLFKALVH
jgi:hypothetical protein